MVVRLHLVVPTLLLLSLGCGTSGLMDSVYANNHLSWTARTRTLPEGAEREALLGVLERTYFCAKAGEIDSARQAALREAFDAAVADGALTAAEVERFSRSAEGCKAPALTGAALATALDEKRAEEEALVAREATLAVYQEKAAAQEEARAFASWDVPRRVEAQAARAGWTYVECGLEEKAERIGHECELRKGTRFATVEVMRFGSEAKAQEQVEYGEYYQAIVERDGSSVMSVWVNDIPEAERLRDALVPRGESLRTLSEELLKPRFEKQGWTVAECTTERDEAETETVCMLLRKGASAKVKLSIEPSTGSKDAEIRDVEDDAAWIDQEGLEASMYVKVTLKEPSAQLRDVLFTPAVPAAVSTPP